MRYICLKFLVDKDNKYSDQYGDVGGSYVDAWRLDKSAVRVLDYIWLSGFTNLAIWHYIGGCGILGKGVDDKIPIETRTISNRIYDRDLSGTLQVIDRPE